MFHDSSHQPKGGQGVQMLGHWPLGAMAAATPAPCLPATTEHEAALRAGGTLIQETAAHGCFLDQLRRSCSAEANLGGGCPWLGLAAHSCFPNRHLGSSHTWPKLAACGRFLDRSSPKPIGAGVDSIDPPASCHPPLPSTGLWAASFQKRGKGAGSFIRAASHH